jgi:hypothetical protein
MPVSWEFNRRLIVTDVPERKPRGFGAFKDLASKLVKVPKAELDKKLAKNKAKKRKK